ncbi:DUF1338 domain-containing protein [Halomonas vilamensis]|uniref:2-oxoadipate dioxygenase/decarboxylase n=1 Tax=Vreelandella vilamensis TaxID=531309 RepID=A0ABU1H1N8_9GAMM|nr:DUF1338 domain-containing protein [Halomonas vilamensis]MDR5898219.1 DUF1338 domain-containing protein [Halomonas vilamensis]
MFFPSTPDQVAQRDAFLQELWLDYVHTHPDIAALRLWPTDTPPAYFTLLTLNHGSYGTSYLTPALTRLGYIAVAHYAMADKGLLISLLAPENGESWLVLAELQTGTLCKAPRDALIDLMQQAPMTEGETHSVFHNGRPWPMPTWQLYQSLCAAHPLAAWLSVMGPRLHHAGFDCQQLGLSLSTLDQQFREAGVMGGESLQHGVFPVSNLLDHRFYLTTAQKTVFAEGDEHRICLGGLAIVQKHVSDAHEQVAELLLPHHTRCEMA